VKRLPWAVFAVLAVATVGAFFLTQHLKTSNPLINGSPRTDPPAINPLHGQVCVDLNGQRVSYRRTKIGFYLQSKADTVTVSVINSDGNPVATAAGSGRLLQPGAHHYAFFTWNGRLSDGRLARAGTYSFRVYLQHRDANFLITTPGATVQVIYATPRPVVTSVRLTGSATASAGPATIAPTADSTGTAGTVTIHWRGNGYRGAQIDIYRTDAPGGVKLVKHYGINPRLHTAVWNGLIGGLPAPAGTYLIGITAIDKACNTGRFPVVVPPAPGSTPHTGVTVRYLAATPPLTPQPAGSLATVAIAPTTAPYTWALRAAGATASSKPIFKGVEPAGHSSLAVRIPPRGAGLYELSIREGLQRTVVPLVASAPGTGAKLLIVLPALSWQGLNAVDDNGDGLPDTLAAGDQIELDRPLAAGLPSDFAAEAGLIEYLQRNHRSFQLTTDVALAAGTGPALSGRTGVILDGPMRWLPSGLGARLRSFARAGGRVLSLGVDSLQSQAAVRGGLAGPPKPLAPDPFGAHHGAIGSTSGLLITPFSDPLDIFAAVPAITGFKSYQAITPPSSSTGASMAGIAASVPAIAGFRLGSGDVVEVGLPEFGSSLAGNVDAQELLDSVLQLLAG
jgi:FlgD Ig-like domain